MPPIQFAIQSYQSRALPLSAQQVVNLFAEAAPRDAKSQVVLLNSPGIKSSTTAGTGPIRGAHTMAGTLYVVSGPRLYSVDAGGTAVSRGSIGGGDRVSMDDNGTQLCIVNGVSGFIYTVADGLSQITDADFQAADTVTFQDGYFLFNRAGTGDFFLSGLRDGTTYSATDFANAEGDPDNLVAAFSNHRELWLLGKKTIEVWYNSGDADFPFDRIDGAFIERGCAAAHSVARIDNTLFWLGEDKIIYRASGFVPERISQHAIEQAIEGYSVISDAFAFTYTLGGHKFYNITFPSAPATWVFDVATGLWHERDSRDSNSVSLGRWQANAYAEAYGKKFVGDFVDGQIGELDWDTFTEYGNTLQGLAAGPPVHSDRKRIAQHRFELDIESGVGLTSGQGSDPQIQLDWSDDGGHTWSSRKPWRSMGKIGEYQQRLRWNRMGSARNRIYRVIVSDPVKRSIVGAHLNPRQGRA